jgi:hypothetical protein
MLQMLKFPPFPLPVPIPSPFHAGQITALATLQINQRLVNHLLLYCQRLVLRRRGEALGSIATGRVGRGLPGGKSRGRGLFLLLRWFLPVLLLLRWCLLLLWRVVLSLWSRSGLSRGRDRRLMGQRCAMHMGGRSLRRMRRL